MFSLSKYNAPDFLPCSQRSFFGFSDFSFPQKLTIPNWLSICNTRKSPSIRIQILHTELRAFNRSSFFNSHYLFSWLRIDFVKGKSMLITLETWEGGHDFPQGHAQATINAYSRFSHDVTKIQTKKLSILLSFWVSWGITAPKRLYLNRVLVRKGSSFCDRGRLNF